MSPAFLAGLDVLDLEVTPIGDDIDALDVEDDAGRFGCLHQQADVHDLVGHGLLDDHFVLRVDGDLRVIADANLRMGGHRRLSGSVSDIWLSPVRSSSARSDP